MRRAIALVLAGLLVDAPMVGAGQAQAGQPAGQPHQAVASQPSDVALLGVSLSRIKRELHESPLSPPETTVLHLRYYIEVVGRAPKIDLFKGIDLTSAPVQYGGMTHNEFLAVVTPKEFRTQSASLVGLAVMAAQALVIKQLSKSKKDKKDKK
jgi:hypothetical protein